MRASNIWRLTQHEVSHAFGAPDRSGAAHPDDIMETIGVPNFWCEAIGYQDYQIVAQHAGTFD